MISCGVNWLAVKFEFVVFLYEIVIKKPRRSKIFDKKVNIIKAYSSKIKIFDWEI